MLPHSVIFCRPYRHVPTVVPIPDQYPGTDRLTFSNLTEVLRRVVIPRLLEQRGLTRRRSLLSGVLSYRYVDTVPPGSQQLMLASFVKVRAVASGK